MACLRHEPQDCASVLCADHVWLALVVPCRQALDLAGLQDVSASEAVKAIKSQPCELIEVRLALAESHHHESAGGGGYEVRAVPEDNDEPVDTTTLVYMESIPAPFQTAFEILSLIQRIFAQVHAKDDGTASVRGLIPLGSATKSRRRSLEQCVIVFRKPAEAQDFLKQVPWHGAVDSVTGESRLSSSVCPALKACDL